jgi:hypothetical protein
MPPNEAPSTIGVNRVIETRPAMQHQQDRLFVHDRAIGHEFRALDIEEEPHPVHGHVHQRGSPEL